MKANYFHLLLFFLYIGKLSIAESKQQGRFTLQVNLEDVRNGINVYLITPNSNAKFDDRYVLPLNDTVAVAEIKEGVANFNGLISIDGEIFMVAIQDSREGLYLLLSKNEHVIVKGKKSEWPKAMVVGSKGTTDWQGYKKGFDAIEKYTGLYDETKEAEWKVKRAEFRKDFIKNNPNSLYTPYVILMNRDMTAAEREIAYDKLTNYSKRSYFGLRIAEAIASNSLKNPIIAGAVIPDFKVTLPDGKMVSVLEVAAKSKYTLIDIWASWCRPCRAEIPKLEKVFENYKDKGLNILGISVDSRDKDWKNALDEENTTWLQSIDKEKNVDKLFAPSAIPVYMLIDKQGNLMAFDCATCGVSNFGGGLRGESLDNKLEQLLGNK